MEIEFNSEDIDQVLQESPHFRQMMIKIITESWCKETQGMQPQDDNRILARWRNEIRARFPDWNQNKIPPIKWIRDVTRGNEEVLAAFARADYGGYRTNTGESILGLAEAKRFVGSV